MKLLFKAPPTHYPTPTAQELALELDYLLLDAKRQGKEVTGISMSGEELKLLNYANLTGHRDAFTTYKDIDIWA